MLQPDGTARLLDMGAAVDVEANDGHASMAVVKKNFSAPEQYMESETFPDVDTDDLIDYLRSAR